MGYSTPAQGAAEDPSERAARRTTGAVLHGADQPSDIALGRGMQRAAEFMTSGDFSPVHLPGTKPQDYLTELAHNPDILAKNIDQGMSFNFGTTTGGRGGVRGGAPSPRAGVDPADMRAYYDEALRVGRISTAEHQGFMDAVQQIESGGSPSSPAPPAPSSPSPPARYHLEQYATGWEIHDQYGPIVTGLAEHDAQDRLARLNAPSAQTEWQAPQNPTATPPPPPPAAPQIIPSQRGFLGGNRQATDAFRQYIAPHASEQEFAEKYFGGMYNPYISFSHYTYYGGGGPRLEFRGPLMQNGRSVGKMTRRILPEEGIAQNAYLLLDEELQGQGIAKRLLSNQVDIYEAMGINKVEVSTGLARGGYAWARYGFLPSEAEWHEVRVEAVARIRPILNDLTSAQRVELESILRTNDPHAIWDLADFTWPVGANQVPLGKYLLSGNDWHGTLDLKDPVTMERFNDYVGRKKQP
jgi:GNAT superfamily N-acetyltransferase